MKIPILISLGSNSFSNVTIEFEGSPEEAIDEGKRLLRQSFAAKDSELPQKEWNQTVDACLKNELKLTPDVWERMSQYQQNFLQEIKRSRNRN